MALTLAITDNANGTATATIGGMNPAYTADLFYMAVDGTFATNVWVYAGGQLGNGTIAGIACGAGYFWWHYDVVDPPNEVDVSPVVYARVTSGQQSLHYQCLDAIRARLQSMTFTGLAGSSIVVRKFPSIESGLTLPAIVICPWGNETVNKTEGVNTRDDYYYPCLVGIAAADNRDLTANLASYLMWRQQIMEALHNQRLPGVAAGAFGAVDTQSIVNLDAWQTNIWASTLLVRFQVRRPRGIS